MNFTVIFKQVLLTVPAVYGIRKASRSPRLHHKKTMAITWGKCVLVALAISLMIGCAGAPPPTPTVTPQPTIDISKLGKNVIVVYDDRIEPTNITIKLGESITWYNAGKNNHSMRSGRGVNSFFTGTMQPGMTVVTANIHEVGETQFADTQNPDKITGKLIVVAP